MCDGGPCCRSLYFRLAQLSGGGSTETLPQRLGKAFRKRREALGFSQESYADEIGMHRTYYSAIERGENNLQLDTLQKVCEGLETSIWEVFKDAEASR